MWVFAHAFDWNATPEGREYWLDIDKMWNNVVKYSHGNN